jgi:M6 family metalloprotease-like protein
MRNFKRYLSVVLALAVVGTVARAQCLFEDPDPALDGEGVQGGLLYESNNGWRLPTHGVIRILVVFLEVDYANPANDPTPPAGNPGWPAHSLPTWVDNPDPDQNLFDWDVPTGTASGLLTRYFQDASSGQFTVLADYLLAPTNGGVFQTTAATTYAARTAVNAALGTTLATGHGFTSITDFDMWTTNDLNTGPGLPKVTPSTESPGRFDHVAFVWRNAGGNQTGYAVPGTPGQMLGHDANTYSVVYAHNSIPFKILRHEFSHLLYGGNSFHTGGGGYFSNGHYFVGLGSGWSNMSLHGASLMSWNAWDRQRMGWMASGQVHEIPAHNAANTAEVNGDLDATVPGDAGIYTLRDFVLTGDALRIKLPFTDPNEQFQEWLWVENHQGRTLNGSPFDKWQYGHDPCVEDLAPGLQMYVQVDKDVRQAATSTAVYGGYGDYLRPLDASGHFERIFADPAVNFCGCWNCTVPPVIRQQPNPLTGLADRYVVPVDLNENDVIPVTEHRLNWLEFIGDALHDELHGFGHNRQVFTVDGNSKVGVGTNPSSATMKTIRGYDSDVNEPKDLHKIHLNGVSVEMLAQNPDGSIQVQVRFDDVDITNDVRWCADTIVLNPVPTTTGHSLNLTTGNTLLLDRGLSPTRRQNPMMFNGEKLFTSPTVLQCKDNTWFNMEPESEVVVDNGSTLLLQPGARFGPGAYHYVMAGVNGSRCTGRLVVAR